MTVLWFKLAARLTLLLSVLQRSAQLVLLKLKNNIDYIKVLCQCNVDFSALSSYNTGHAVVNSLYISLACYSVTMFCRRSGTQHCR
ncbi:hypothetical protein BaRGS_00004168 [Batillaria attramentaria]|uniref:Secreted protein n=1 Tax=Batillaria attramentaria TaxID=370345 RepID=A0ABD0LZ36_9CAEN